MTKVALLEALKARVKDVVSELILPCKMQKGDTAPEHRAPEVFMTRIPDAASPTKKAPYVLLQPINGKSKQKSGEQMKCSVMVRIICCVYNENGQEGGLMLLNLMERLRTNLLMNPIVGDQFELNIEDEGGLEDLFYPDDTAPFYLGEIAATFDLPPVTREVSKYWA